jgi:hypothetical protein
MTGKEVVQKLLKAIQYLKDGNNLKYMGPDCEEKFYNIIEEAEVFVKEPDKETEMKEAILDVLSQEIDHICWMDIYTKLAKVVGVPFDPTLVPRPIFEKNCQRFTESIYSGQPYAVDKMTEELERLRKSKDLQHKATMRAINKWREYSGKTLEQPDKADLVCWLLHQLDMHNPKVGEKYKVDIKTNRNVYHHLVEITEVHDVYVRFKSLICDGTMTVDRSFWREIVSNHYERTLGQESTNDLSDNEETTSSNKNRCKTSHERPES